MEKGTFGESLKREREMRGVTLEEIASATRIAERFLRAIENDQWEQLPGGVFNRGFVRAMARYLGLDEENIVAEYTMAVGDRPSVPVWTGSPPVVTPDQPWLAWGVTALIVLALLAGSWIGVRHLLAWRASKHAAQVSSLGADGSPASSSASSSSAAARNASQSPAPNAASGAADSSSSATPDAPTAAADAAGNSAPITATVADRFELKVEAAKKTRITVTADKDVVYKGTMKAGENQLFSAADHFEITAKDAGAVRLELNGKTIPPIGPSGHSGKVTLTRDSLKDAPGGGN
jgi:cytoskeleton protein RodZ